MRRQLKYLNIVLTVVAVLLALNLFKDEPKPADASIQTLTGSISIDHRHYFSNKITN
jgi:hypothetical protein